MEQTLINGHKVEFDEKAHIYLVDGVIVPSVTQVIRRKFPEKYANVDEEILKRAGQKGTAMHKLLELYELGEKIQDTEETLNYKLLKRLYGFEVEEVEKIIIIEYKGVIICAGKLDQIILLPNKNGEMKIRCVNDFKRTAEFDKEWLSWQETIYAIGYEQSYGKKIDELRGTHLRNDKKQFVVIKRIDEMCMGLFEEIYQEQKNENIFA